MGRLVLTAILLGAAVACSDSTDPGMTAVAGSYEATSFTTTTTGGTPNDELADGASLALVLNANGTVTGSLVAPFGSPSMDMAGTWSRSGNTVSFSQAADTFVRDMDFTVAGTTLVGDDTFGGTRIQVTLTRE